MGYVSNRIDSCKIKPGDHIYTWRSAYTYSHHGIYVGESMVVHFTSQEDAAWNLFSCCRSSITNPYASCLNSCSCEFSQPKAGKTGINSVSSLRSNQSSSSQNVQASRLSFPECGFQQEGSGVVISCLNRFIGSGSLYLFQYEVNKLMFLTRIRGGTCTAAKSDPPEEVIHRAMCLLQNGFGRYDMFRNNCEDFALYCKTGLLIDGKPTTGTSGQVNYFAKAIPNSVVSLGIRLLSGSNAPALGATVGLHYWERYKTDIGVRDDVVKVNVEDLKSVGR